MKKDRENIIAVFKKWLQYGGDDVPFMDKSLLQKWKTSPNLWRKFQQRVYHLVVELERLHLIWLRS